MLKKMQMILASWLVFIMPFNPIHAEEPETVPFEEVLLVDAGEDRELEEGISDEECLQGYFERQLYGGGSIQTFSFFSVRDTLNEFEKMVYDAYKTKIENIAAGTETETLITLNASEYIPQMRFSAEELGVEHVIGKNQKLLDEAYDAFMNAVQIPEYDAEKVAYALRFDCAFECFWADLQYKAQQPVSSVAYGVTLEGEEYIYTAGDFQFGFYAARDYRMNSHTVDQRKMSAVNTAAETARAIVAAAEGMGDYEKLRYYAETICELTDYNQAAAAPGYLNSRGYGNPWQPIYVFDNDPSTGVVCEGYAKAFKYLTDLSVFEDESVYAGIVTGDLIGANGGKISHMWNVVHMEDGRNYLVDVTNMDKPDGIREHLFISHYSMQNEDGSYTFTDAETGFQYGLKYDTETMALYSMDELAISSEPYFLPQLSCRIEEVSVSSEDRIALNCMIKVQHPELLGTESGQVYADILVRSDVPKNWRMDLKPEDCQNGQILVSVPMNAAQTNVPVQISLWVNGVEVQSVQKSCGDCLEELMQMNSTLKKHDLANAALCFGTYADAYFAHKNDILPVDEEIDVSYYRTALSQREQSAIRLCSTSLLLKDQVSVRIYFILKDGYRPEDLVFTLNGQVVTDRVHRTEDGRYYLDSDGIRADKLMQFLHLQVTQEGEKAAELLYSPISYVETAMRKKISSGLSNLLKALYLYARAAAEYNIN